MGAGTRRTAAPPALRTSRSPTFCRTLVEWRVEGSIFFFFFFDSVAKTKVLPRTERRSSARACGRPPIHTLTALWLPHHDARVVIARFSRLRQPAGVILPGFGQTQTRTQAATHRVILASLQPTILSYTDYYVVLPVRSVSGCTIGHHFSAAGQRHQRWKKTLSLRAGHRTRPDARVSISIYMPA